MRTIILVGFCLTLAGPAMAQVTCQTFGAMTRCTDPNGYNSTSQTFGNQTRIQENGPTGQQRTTTCQRFGNLTRCY
jgi:hypothetical protein